MKVLADQQEAERLGLSVTELHIMRKGIKVREEEE